MCSTECSSSYEVESDFDDYFMEKTLVVAIVTMRWHPSFYTVNRKKGIVLFSS